MVLQHTGMQSPSGDPRRRSNSGMLSPQLVDSFDNLQRSSVSRQPSPFSRDASPGYSAMKRREENEELRVRYDGEVNETRRQIEKIQSQPILGSAALHPRHLERLEPLSAAPLRSSKSLRTLPHASGHTPSVSKRVSEKSEVSSVSRRACEQSIQTDEGDPRDRSDLYLEAAHQRAGEKTRELRSAHKRIKQLEAQVLSQDKMLTQYKSEMERLEERLRIAILKQHRAEQERDFSHQSLKNDRMADQSGRSPCISQAWAKPNFDDDSTCASSQNTPKDISPSSGSLPGGFLHRPMSANIASRPKSARRWSNCGESRDEAAFEEPSSTDDEEDAAENIGINRPNYKGTKVEQHVKPVKHKQFPANILRGMEVRLPQPGSQMGPFFGANYELTGADSDSEPDVLEPFEYEADWTAPAMLSR